MKQLRLLEKSKDFWFLLISCFLFFLLRLPSLFEPYWYGDEGIYQVLGMAIRQGRLLYRDIWDNKPPLLYVFYSFFNGDQFAVRLASLVAGLLAVVLFFLLARKLFNSLQTEKARPKDDLAQRPIILEMKPLAEKAQKALYISTGLFVLFFATPLIEGNIANAENFMLLLSLAAALLLVYSARHMSKLPLFLAGLLLSISFLFKIVALFDFAAFMSVLFLSHLSFKNFLQSLLETTRKTVPLILGFAIPILGTVVFFALSSALKDFLSATLAQNVSYVGYGNTLIIPQGLLILKLTLLAGLMIYLLLQRQRFSFPSLFLISWFGFSLFNAFFSQRPYTHYLLTLLPSFCLLCGSIFLYDKQFYKKRAFVLEKLALFLPILLLLFASLVIAKNFKIYPKTMSYYGNFLAFITGIKSIPAYQAFFDKKTPTDYSLATYINMHAKPTDGLFIWGNNAQLYKLTNKLPPGRYTVAYHIASTKHALQETQEAIQQKKPRFLVLTSIDDSIPFHLPMYSLQIIINRSAIYRYGL